MGERMIWGGWAYVGPSNVAEARSKLWWRLYLGLPHLGPVNTWRDHIPPPHWDTPTSSASRDIAQFNSITLSTIQVAILCNKPYMKEEALELRNRKKQKVRKTFKVYSNVTVTSQFQLRGRQTKLVKGFNLKRASLNLKTRQVYGWKNIDYLATWL